MYPCLESKDQHHVASLISNAFDISFFAAILWVLLLKMKQHVGHVTEIELIPLFLGPTAYVVFKSAKIVII